MALSVLTLDDRLDPRERNGSVQIIKRPAGDSFGLIEAPFIKAQYNRVLQDAPRISDSVLTQSTTIIKTAILNTATGGAALSVNVPGLVPGDVVIVVCNVNGNTTIADNNGARPFSKDLADHQVPVSGMTTSIFSRRIQAGDPSTFAFTAGAAARWTCVAVVLQTPNVSTYDANIVSGAQSDTGSTTGTAPSITTVTANAIHLAILAADISGTIVDTTPAGYPVIANGGEEAVAIVAKVLPTPGPSGALDFGFNQTASWYGISLAIRDVSSAALLQIADDDVAISEYGRLVKDADVGADLAATADAAILPTVARLVQLPLDDSPALADTQIRSRSQQFDDSASPADGIVQGRLIELSDSHPVGDTLAKTARMSLADRTASTDAASVLAAKMVAFSDAAAADDSVGRQQSASIGDSASADDALGQALTKELDRDSVPTADAAQTDRSHGAIVFPDDSLGLQDAATTEVSTHGVLLTLDDSLGADDAAVMSAYVTQDDITDIADEFETQVLFQFYDLELFDRPNIDDSLLFEMGLRTEFAEADLSLLDAVETVVQYGLPVSEEYFYSIAVGASEVMQVVVDNPR